MPRMGRLYVPGGLFHVLGRGIERKTLFSGGADKADFLNRLEKGLNKTDHQCYAWALMDNHYHLLLSQSQYALSELMGPFLGGYALCYNKHHRRVGYLYQGRYQSILCEEDSYFLELVRYIQLNPLKARMVEDLNALEIYPWTGHAVLVGNRELGWQNCDDVLSLFGDKQSLARRRYKNFVADTTCNSDMNDYEGGGLARSVGGWGEVRKLRGEQNIRLSDERILGDETFVQKALALAESRYERAIAFDKSCDVEQLIANVCIYFGLDRKALTGRGRQNRISHAKAVIAYFGCYEFGISTVVMAKHLAISHQGVSMAIKRGKVYVEENALTVSALSCRRPYWFAFFTECIPTNLATNTVK